MEIANASLLDEGTAAAEAMIMMFNNRSKNQKSIDERKFFVDSNILPQTLSVLQTRANPLNIEIILGDIIVFLKMSFLDVLFNTLEEKET